MSSPTPNPDAVKGAPILAAFFRANGFDSASTDMLETYARIVLKTAKRHAIAIPVTEAERKRKMRIRRRKHVEPIVVWEDARNEGGEFEQQENVEPLVEDEGVRGDEFEGEGMQAQNLGRMMTTFFRPFESPEPEEYEENESAEFLEDNMYLEIQTEYDDSEVGEVDQEGVRSELVAELGEVEMEGESEESEEDWEDEDEEMDGG